MLFEHPEVETGEDINLNDELRGIDYCNHGDKQDHGHPDRYNKGYQSIPVEQLQAIQHAKGK